MTGAGVEAPGRSGVGGGGVGGGGRRLRRNKPRLLGTGGRPSRPSNRSGSGELPLPPPRGGNPRALHMGCAVEPPALAACPAPPVAAILLRLVPAILTRSSPSAHPHRSNPAPTAKNVRPGIRILFHGHVLLQEAHLALLHLVVALPEMVELPVVGRLVLLHQARRRRQQGDNPDSQRRGVAVACATGVGVAHSSCVIGEDLIMVLVVLVVECGGGCDDEDITDADHAHVGREAVAKCPV